MGMSGVKLSDDVVAEIVRRTKAGESQSTIAKALGIAESSVSRHQKLQGVSSALPIGKETATPTARKKVVVSQCPDAEPAVYTQYRLEKPGHWLVLGDVHVPYHDRPTVEAAIRQAKRDGAVGVVLNGDTLDSHEISSHDKDPSAPRYVREVEVANQFLSWVRGQLPKAEIVFKEGNHEARLNKYIMGRAPALFDLEFVNLRSLLHFADHGIVEVKDKRVIKAGKLHLIHGHEYQGGGGVNPARWLYLRARSIAACGHFHRTSEHHARDIGQKYEATWSIGCACHLSPAYAPLNEWNHGYAMVELFNDDNFVFRNMRVMGGKVL
jgi:predicted phosphodiesterase